MKTQYQKLGKLNSESIVTKIRQTKTNTPEYNELLQLAKETINNPTASHGQQSVLTLLTQNDKQIIDDLFADNQVNFNITWNKDSTGSDWAAASGSSHLSEALQKDNQYVFQKLINTTNVDVNQFMPINHLTPLAYAIYYNKPWAVEALLARKDIDLNKAHDLALKATSVPSGVEPVFTPLDAAICQNNAKIVEGLLKKGAIPVQFWKNSTTTKQKILQNTSDEIKKTIKPYSEIWQQCSEPTDASEQSVSIYKLDSKKLALQLIEHLQEQGHLNEQLQVNKAKRHVKNLDNSLFNLSLLKDNNYIDTQAVSKHLKTNNIHLDDNGLISPINGNSFYLHGVANKTTSQSNHQSSISEHTENQQASTVFTLKESIERQLGTILDQLNAVSPASISIFANEQQKNNNMTILPANQQKDLITYFLHSRFSQEQTSAIYNTLKDVLSNNQNKPIQMLFNHGNTDYPISVKQTPQGHIEVGITVNNMQHTLLLTNESDQNLAIEQSTQSLSVDDITQSNQTFAIESPSTYEQQLSKMLLHVQDEYSGSIPQDSSAKNSGQEITTKVIKKTSPATLQQKLICGMDPNSSTTSETMLYNALKTGNYEDALILLSYGAKFIATKNDYQETKLVLDMPKNGFKKFLNFFKSNKTQTDTVTLKIQHDIPANVLTTLKAYQDLWTKYGVMEYNAENNSTELVLDSGYMYYDLEKNPTLWQNEAFKNLSILSEDYFSEGIPPLAIIGEYLNKKSGNIKQLSALAKKFLDSQNKKYSDFNTLKKLDVNSDTYYTWDLRESTNEAVIEACDIIGSTTEQFDEFNS